MKVVFVLGMHRSGTSCLARCLDNMGLSFVLDQLGPTDSKHLEYGPVNRLNDEILGNWREPVLTRNPIMRSYYKCKVGNFLKSAHKGKSFVGIKDPRIVFTFPFWIKHVDEFKVIGIYRRPLEVTRSLMARTGYSYADYDQSLKLWQISNNELISLQKQHGFPLLSFNLSKMEFGRRFQSICLKLALPFSMDVFEQTFIEKERHHIQEKMPDDLRHIYEELENISHQNI